MILDRARRIAASRKSNWNALLLFSNLTLWPLLTFGFSSIAYRFHLTHFPAETIHATSDHFFPFLPFFACFVAAVPLSMLLSNALAYVIPPARIALSNEAREAGMDGFAVAQRKLLLLAAVTTPLGLGVAAVLSLHTWMGAV